VATIEDEQAVVKDLLTRAGSDVNAIKAVVGWLGEEASRLKLDNPLQSYSALNCLEQVERLLAAGHTGEEGALGCYWCHLTN